MTESQIQLQNALVTTFLANLAFLSEYDSKLYNRVDGLSRHIEKGEYQEQYRLEFNQDDGDFDIFDIKNDKYLYNKKPAQYNKKVLTEINFDTKGSFSILEPYYFLDNNVIPKSDDDTIFIDSGRELINNINEYKEILKDNLSTYNDQKLKKIEKVVFIGTLLGRHIPLILEKTKSQNFFVCEKNLEIFRLSLFVVDYSNLARDGKSVVFSIMEEDYNFIEQCSIFLRNAYHQNYCIKYYTTNYDIEEYFDYIMDALTSEKTVGFNHLMMLDNVAKSSLERTNKYKVINRNLAQNMNLNIKSKPILYLCAGPSLMDNIDWIYENKDKFIIFAIGASCKKLLSHNIVPDIVATLDPQFEVLDKYHFDSETVKKLDNTIILASMNSDKRILDKFNQNNLYLFEVIASLQRDEKVEDGYSVGEIVGTLLLNLEVKELYLIGLDLALNQESGETHISGYETSLKYDLDNVESSLEKNSFSLREDIIKVKGNFKDKVYTTRLFSTSLNTFSSSCVNLKQENQNIYNLSINGAFISNTIPKKIDEINTLEFEYLKKNLIFNEIKDDFETISSIDKNEIKNYLTEEKKYLLGVLEFLQDDSIIQINCFEDFSKRYLIIEEALINPEIRTAFLRVIFAFYFRSIIPYIFFHFNNNKIKKENAKIKKINEIFNKQVIEIIERYLSYIEKF